MYSIGEFSKITSLSIKSLRIYHEKKILVPASVDEFTSYRYYDDQNIETANAVSMLKKIGFSLGRIKEILTGYEADSDIIDFLKQQQAELASKIHHHQQMVRSIDHIIQMEEKMAPENTVKFEIEVKAMETMLIAAYPMKGRYRDVGQGFTLLGKHLGRQIVGKPMILHHDREYREEASFEACFPVRKGHDRNGIYIRELPGGLCVTLIHKGAFEQVGTAYQKLFTYINSEGYTPLLPYREVYIKGPGTIFKGSPTNYLTEVIIPVDRT